MSVHVLCELRNKVISLFDEKSTDNLSGLESLRKSETCTMEILT